MAVAAGRFAAFAGGFAVTGVVLVTAVAQGSVDASAAEASPSTRQPATSVPDPAAERVEALHRKHACSSEGLGPDVIPAHAVISDHEGIRLVSFDEGWAVHLGEQPGRLISVCAR